MTQKANCHSESGEEIIRGGLSELTSEIRAVRGNCGGSEAILRDVQLRDKSGLFLENNMGGRGSTVSLWEMAWFG